MKRKRPNPNKRWDNGRWAKWWRERYPTAAPRKRRGTKRGKHK